MSGSTTVLEQFRMCVLPFPLLRRGITNFGMSFANLGECSTVGFPDYSPDTYGSLQHVFILTRPYPMCFPKLMTESSQELHFDLPTQVFSCT